MLTVRQTIHLIRNVATTQNKKVFNSGIFARPLHALNHANLSKTEQSCQNCNLRDTLFTVCHQDGKKMQNKFAGAIR